MPIRFRCYNCQQLLGIARRNAGTQVDCPTCRRTLTVPNQDQDDAPLPAPLPVPAPAPVPVPAPALFERDDFDALLRPPPSMAVDAPPRYNGGSPQPAPINRPAPIPDYSAQGPSWQAGSEAPVPAGLLLPPARATILTVAVILLLAVAFGAGLLVGRFYL